MSAHFVQLMRQLKQDILAAIAQRAHDNTWDGSIGILVFIHRARQHVISTYPFVGPLGRICIRLPSVRLFRVCGSPALVLQYSTVIVLYSTSTVLVLVLVLVVLVRTYVRPYKHTARAYIRTYSTYTRTPILVLPVLVLVLVLVLSCVRTNVLRTSLVCGVCSMVMASSWWVVVVGYGWVAYVLGY